MSVYIDMSKNTYGRMLMSHMIADTIEELHSMADKIGVKRKFFQNISHHPHYDICQSKKHLAISLGAIEVNKREFIDIIVRNRKK